MSKKVTLEFIFEDGELEDFAAETMEEFGLSADDFNLREWVFGEICQNQGFGFLSGLSVVEAGDPQ